MTWDNAFRQYLQRLDQQKPVLACGDMNVAHEEIDIKNPKTNHHNAGFTDEERAQFTTLLNSRFQARQKNAGWRIDYFLVSEDARDRMRDAKIHTPILGSDHCPVEVEASLLLDGGQPAS